jgi:hypothetical protein
LKRHVALVFALPLAVACRSPDFHVVLGQRYDASGDCLEPTSSIDIVEGSDPGLDCSPTCLVTPAGVVYATTTCGAFPPLDDVTGTAAGCSAALAALAQGVVCGAGDDGGDGGATDDGAAEEGSDGAEAGPGASGDGSFLDVVAADSAE